jgi:hypothetical protein
MTPRQSPPLNPRSPELHRFLTAPTKLTEDPTYRALQANIAFARDHHRQTRAHIEALEAYVRALLRPRASA